MTSSANRLVAILAAAIIAFGGGSHSLWLDEAYSVLVAEQSLPGIANMLKNSSNPPLYHLVLKVWMALFGDGEWAMRNLSGIFYLLATWGVFKIGEELSNDKKSGFLAAVFFLSAHIVVKHTHFVRMYLMLVCIEAWAIWFFLRLFYLEGKPKTLRLWAAWVALNLMGMLTHYWYVFVLAAQFAVYAACCPKGRWKQFLTGMALSIPGFLLLWGKVFFVQLKLNSGTNSYLGYANYRHLIESFQFFYARDNPTVALLLFGAFALVAPYLLFSLHHGKRGYAAYFNDKTNLMLLLLLAAVSLLPWVVGHYTPVYNSFRHTIITMVPLSLVLGGFFGRLANQKLNAAIAAGLLLLCLSFYFHQLGFYESPSSKKVAADIAELAAPNDVLIYITLSGLTMEHYLGRTGRDDLKRYYFPREIGGHPAWRNVAEMQSNMDTLGAEAESLALSLKGNIGQNNQVWVCYSPDAPIAELLLQHLGRYFSPKASHDDWKGSFLTKVLVYGPKV